MPAGQYKISINDLSYQFSYYYYNTDSQGKVEYVYREEDTVERNFENNGYLTIRRKDKEPFKSREDIIKAINAVTIERVVKGVIPCGKSEKKKRIVFLGDSTIGMERGDTSIPEIVAQLSRDVCYNCAMGGTRATQHEDYWKYYDFEEIANSIANSDFSNQNKYLSKEDIPKYFADVIAAFTNIDFSTVDIIAINYGANDYNAGKTVEEFITAYKNGIAIISEAYSNIRFLIITPSWYYFCDSKGEYLSDCDIETFNDLNQTLPDFIASIKNDLCKEYHLPVADVYYEMGINKYNSSLWMIDGDQSHPNVNGREMFARYIVKILSGM